MQVEYFVMKVVNVNNARIFFLKIIIIMILIIIVMMGYPIKIQI
jgi:hypothetical protein